MHLRHIALPVHDRNRSIQFYATYFGFDPATATSHSDGTTIVHNADGFDLALHPVVTPIVHPDFLHFGFTMTDGEAVREHRRHMELNGVPIVEYDEEPDLVSFKCLDPDGWRVEVYSEQP